MAFLVGSEVPFYGRQLRARRLDSWRSAAELVQRRWEDAVHAPCEARRTAFAAYTAALDAEAAAAARLADSYPSLAA
jgi:hypothetical protein